MVWQHNDLTVASAGPEMEFRFGGLVAYTWDVDQTQHVVYNGADSHVHELWFHHGDGWNHIDLTATTSSPLSVGGLAGYTWDVDDTQHIVYVSADGHIHELWFHHGDGWNHNDLTAAAGGSLGLGAVNGYTRAADQTQHVIYLGTDNHIHELWFHHGDGWNHNDLSLAAASPPNSSGNNPIGYQWEVDTTQHVVGGGGDFHIHELWYDGRWHHNDLTTAAGGPLAADWLTAYTWDIDETQHVVHRGASDGHIHELWFHHRDGWNHHDLTTATGGPQAGNALTGYTWNLDQTQHVLYTGREGGVNELRFRQGEGWSNIQVAAATQVPGLGAGIMVGYTWDVDQTQHVVYRGADNHVHELWFHH
ncbi:hypothetical protein [Actinoplanes sp. NBRC 103695]|uniref:hypothetical protein n=1 Tax=Actinoplanes sp. NBRC 103695 TaxID=3032202 RepID=UPI0025573157|nr:hypothetical protein [Actinoplanes sp. NBRC 103695]